MRKPIKDEKEAIENSDETVSEKEVIEALS